MRILVAPDKFRGSLSAPEVARSLAAGMREAGAEAVELPVADGGDGTLAVLAAGGFALHPIEVTGPVGAVAHAHVAVRGEVGAVEIAETSGLSLLRDSAPMRASSYGLGEAIASALDLGCREIVVALGGSACTDGGAGLLQALGAHLADAADRPIPQGGSGLGLLSRVDLAPVRRRLSGARLVAACDVTNPLLGREGAARVYGPQKGVTPAQAADLDRWLGGFVAAMERAGAPRVADHPGAGAAGGAGYALLALGAEFARGVDWLLDLLGFPAHLAQADLAVTGEGCLDVQTLHGKAPLGVAAAASRAGVRVVAAVGRNTLAADQLRAAGFARVHALTDLEPDLARCIADAPALLHETGRRVAVDAERIAVEAERSQRP